MPQEKNFSNLINYARENFKNKNEKSNDIEKNLKNITPSIKGILKNTNSISGNLDIQLNSQRENYNQLLDNQIKNNSFLIGSLIDLKNYISSLSYNTKNNEKDNPRSFVENKNSSYLNNSFIKNNNLQKNIQYKTFDNDQNNQNIDNFIKNGSPLTKIYTKLATKPYDWVSKDPGPYRQGFELKSKELYGKNAIEELIKEISNGIQKKFKTIDINKFLSDAVQYKNISNNTNNSNIIYDNTNTENNFNNEKKLFSDNEVFGNILKFTENIYKSSQKILNVNRKNNDQLKTFNDSVLSLIGKDQQVENEENIEKVIEKLEGINNSTENLKKSNEKENNETQNNQEETQNNQKEGNNFLRKLLLIFDRKKYQDLEDRLEGMKERFSSIGGTKIPNLPNKGLGGFLSSILSSIFLGPKGAALLSSMIPATLGVAGKTLFGGIAAILLGPKLFESIKAGLEKGGDEGFTAGVGELLDTFFKEEDIKSNLGAGAALGFLAFKGPRGIIPGMILGGTMNFLKKMWGDKVFEPEGGVTKGKFHKILTDSAIGGLLGAAVLGIPGILLGGSFNALYGVLTDKDTHINPTSITTGIMGLIAGLSGGALLGAKLGLVGGPIGALAGAMLGAALGVAFGSWITDTEAKKAVQDIAKDSNEHLQLMNKKLSPEGLTEQESVRMNELNENYQLKMSKVASSPQEASTKLFAAHAVDPSQINDTMELIDRMNLKNELSTINRILNTNMSKIGDLFTFDVDEQSLKLKNNASFDVKKIPGDPRPDAPKHNIKFDANENLENILLKAGGNTASQISQRLINQLNSIARSSPEFDRMSRERMQDKSRRFGPQDRKNLQGKYINDILLEIPMKKTGGVFNKPELIMVGESSPNNPEILFNRQQLEALGQIFNMQKENKNMSQSLNVAPIVIPPNTSNYFDNKNISVQEYNITEIPPEPNSSVSFKDSLSY
jgi:hypothetical protein